MANIITLTGPSGSGKSTAIKYFLKYNTDFFKPQVIAKYSTRQRRKEDSFEIKAGYEQLPSECDLVYEQYGVRYGLILQEVYDVLSQGQSPIVILNDVRAVDDIRSLLGGLVKSVFIYRSDPDLELMNRIALDRGQVDKSDVTRRYQKAQSIYRIYIENIHLFNHVIINRYSRSELAVQVKRIIQGFKQSPNWPLRQRKR